MDEDSILTLMTHPGQVVNHKFKESNVFIYKIHKSLIWWFPISDYNALLLVFYPEAENTAVLDMICFSWCMLIYCRLQNVVIKKSNNVTKKCEFYKYYVDILVIMWTYFDTLLKLKALFLHYAASFFMKSVDVDRIAIFLFNTK